MKLIISRSLLIASAAAGADIVNAITGENLPMQPDAEAGVLPEFEGKNASLTYSNVFECYSLDINDAIIVKMLGLYVKVAKAVGPLIRAVTKLIETLKPEFAAVDAELFEGIEPVNYREPVEAPDTEQYMAAYDAFHFER